ncbi:MAG: hemerythrin domain-containing protein [Chloroflexota bacterium]
MDPFTLLEKDHRAVEQAFKKFENAGTSQEKKKIAQQIIADLRVHTTIEEEIFYPVARRKMDSDGREMIAEAFEEHHMIKVLMDEIEQLRSANEQFEAKMTVLQENVEHHVEEEENELFPDARKRLGNSADQLGTKMAERKKALTAGVH